MGAGLRLALRAVLALSGFASLAASCGGERTAPSAPPETPGEGRAALGGRAAARVGSRELDRSLVTAVAKARNLPAKAALDALIEEEVLAEAARRAGALGVLGMRARLDGPLTRLMLDRMRAEALAKGPWTDDEITRLSAAHWQELDRPEGRVVVHALVKAAVPDAETLAKRLRVALASANGTDAQASTKAFTTAAHAFRLPDGQPPHVEELAFVADGRMLEGTGKVLDSFVKGTFAIPEALGTSEVVQTTYGFHVVRLLAIVPPKVASRQEREARLEVELIADRVKKVQEARLAELGKATPTQLLSTDQDLALPR